MGTDKEPAVFQVTTSGTIVRYGEAQGSDSRGVGAICEDRESNIWLGTYSGLYYIRAGKVFPIREIDLRTAFIFSLLWDRENSLWVGTSDGLYHLFSNPIEHYGGSSGLGSVNSLSIGPSGLFANIFSGGTYLLQSGAWSKRAELSDSVANGQLFEAANGDIWLSEETICEYCQPGKTRVTENIGGKAWFCENGNTVWIVNPTNVFAFREEKLVPMGEGWPAMDITGVVTNSGGDC